MSQTTQETIGIASVEELSEETVEELTDIGAIPEDEADEYTDRIQLTEMNVGTPSKTPFGESVKNFIEQKSDRLHSAIEFFQRETVYAEIYNVINNDNGNVAFKLDHKHVRKAAWYIISSDSTALANLLDYTNTDTPHDLDGKRIPLQDHHSDDKAEPRLLIPKNVSTTGKLRFKTTQFLQNLRAKLKPFFKDDILINMVSLASFIPLVILGGIFNNFGNSAAISYPTIALSLLFATIPATAALYYMIRLVLFLTLVVVGTDNTFVGPSSGESVRRGRCPSRRPNTYSPEHELLHR